MIEFFMAFLACVLIFIISDYLGKPLDSPINEKEECDHNQGAYHFYSSGDSRFIMGRSNFFCSFCWHEIKKDYVNDSWITFDRMSESPPDGY